METHNKLIKEMEEAMNRAEIMSKYFRFMANKEEDEKKKAQINVQADTYEVTFTQTKNGLEAFKEFVNSLA